MVGSCSHLYNTIIFLLLFQAELELVLDATVTLFHSAHLRNRLRYHTKMHMHRPITKIASSKAQVNHIRLADTLLHN